MQKRDQFGRFLKGKAVKKKAKKPPKTAHKFVTQKVLKGHRVPNLNELTPYDLQDMIQAEVMFQMKQIW